MWVSILLLTTNIPFGIYCNMKKTHPVKKAELTRQFIIEKTAPIFNQKGIFGTTIADLTQATGLTKGSIYGNFKDKNAVAIAVFKHNVANLIDYLTKYIDQKECYVEKLLSLSESYRNLYPFMIEFGGCPLANTATESDDTHPELRELTANAMEGMVNRIVDLIEGGKRAGEIEPLVDSQKTADVIMSLIEGGTILSKTTQRKGFIMNSLEQVDYLIYSIKKQIPIV